jgi:hypothetical protein
LRTHYNCTLLYSSILRDVAPLGASSLIYDFEADSHTVTFTKTNTLILDLHVQELAMLEFSLSADVEPQNRPNSVSIAAWACDELFRELWSRGTLYHDILQEEYDRFLLWVSGVGVFAELQLSLDFRLREMDDVRLSIVAQLTIISTHLMRLARVPASDLESLHDLQDHTSKRSKRSPYGGKEGLGQVLLADAAECYGPRSDSFRIGYRAS